VEGGQTFYSGDPIFCLYLSTTTGRWQQKLYVQYACESQKMRCGNTCHSQSCHNNAQRLSKRSCKSLGVCQLLVGRQAGITDRKGVLLAAQRLVNYFPSDGSCSMLRGKSSYRCHVIGTKRKSFHMDRNTRWNADGEVILELATMPINGETPFNPSIARDITVVATTLSLCHSLSWSKYIERSVKVDTMRLLAALFLASCTGIASSFSINDLQKYSKEQRLGNGLLIPNNQLSEQKNGLMGGGSSMMTTKRDTIQMPSSTPMVPWKVSFFMLDNWLEYLMGEGLIDRIKGRIFPDHPLWWLCLVPPTVSDSPYAWCSFFSFCLLTSWRLSIVFCIRHLDRMLHNLLISILPCIGIGH